MQDVDLNWVAIIVAAIVLAGYELVALVLMGAILGAWD